MTKETLEHFIAPPLLFIAIIAFSALLLRFVPDATEARDARIYAQGACEGDGKGHMLLDGGCLKQ
jgi:hypothetical protein